MTEETKVMHELLRERYQPEELVEMLRNWREKHPQGTSEEAIRAVWDQTN